MQKPMILSLLFLLGGANSLPPGWIPTGRSIAIGRDYESVIVIANGKCRVDSTGKYFYSFAARWNIETGEKKNYWLRAKNSGNDIRYQLSWSTPDPHLWPEVELESIIFAKGEELGIVTLGSAGRPASAFISRIDESYHPVQFDLYGFTDRGCPMLLPFDDVEILPIKTKPPTLVLDKQHKIQIRSRDAYLEAISNGLNVRRGEGYVNYGSAKFLGRIVSRGNVGSLSQTSIPVRLANGYGQGILTLLADGYIYETLKRNGDERRLLVRYDPSSKRRLYVNDLAIVGSSHDGRYVAYSRPPYRTVEFAKVGK